MLNFKKACKNVLLLFLFKADISVANVSNRWLLALKRMLLHIMILKLRNTLRIHEKAAAAEFSCRAFSGERLWVSLTPVQTYKWLMFFKYLSLYVTLILTCTLPALFMSSRWFVFTCWFIFSRIWEEKLIRKIDSYYIVLENVEKNSLESMPEPASRFVMYCTDTAITPACALFHYTRGFYKAIDNSQQYLTCPERWFPQGHVPSVIQ